MPAARRLLRRHRPRQSFGRGQDGEDARRRVRFGLELQGLRGGVAMNATVSEAAETPAVRALSLETVGMTKIFGSLVALEDVSIKVEAGSFHALLGENGAGEAPLVQCIMGLYSARRGQGLLKGPGAPISRPRGAAAGRTRPA